MLLSIATKRFFFGPKLWKNFDPIFEQNFASVFSWAFYLAWNNGGPSLPSSSSIYDSRLKMDVKYLFVSVNVRRFPCTWPKQFPTQSLAQSSTRWENACKKLAQQPYYYSGFSFQTVGKVQRLLGWICFWTHLTHTLMQAWYENKLQTNSSTFLHSFMSIANFETIRIKKPLNTSCRG